MDFTYDEEQLALQDAVRGLLATSYGDFGRRRRATAEEPGFDPHLWGRLAGMGVLGLPFPEQVGGSGAGPLEVGIVAAELGRVLAPEPFLTSVVLAGGLVAAVAPTAQATSLLEPLAEGASLLTLAHQEPGRRWHTGARRTTAHEADGGWRLSGVKEPVPAGAQADRLVVSARVPDGATALFVVDGGTAGLQRSDYRVPDGRRAARVVLEQVAAVPLGEVVDRQEALADALDRTRAAAFAEVVGGMDAALTATTAYLRSRVQFGVPLSSFQALKFRAADMYVALELTRSLVLWATMRLADRAGEADRSSRSDDAVARAGLQVSGAARLVFEEAVQLHGGIGMTAEYAVGHHLTRLTVLEGLLGNGDHYRQQLVAGVRAHAELDPLT
ncbi:MAG: Acyl-CoA dehydrogenase family protein [uncultured Nocardioidaceae bacterium]|uniref:Acyl-CoA dehydrogenase family protein n=1 Tax=uncultured Nocardioidaceae bacterium TaxID=253824 RepID=A0A6J4LBU8_9ACTN|nr:MAG: Acyl-CoA dehydrogenase family protein [uncultured Nocardioidaceae bacterium]